MPGATITRRVFIGLLLAVLPACSSSSPNPGHKLTWRTISRGLTGGLVHRGQYVIRDETAYFKLWADLTADSPRAALPPPVDFTKEMVIAIAMGSRPTGGYHTEVVDIELRGRTAHVLVSERTPRPGELQIQVTTHPYHFVVLPALRARVDFRFVDEATATRGTRDARPGKGGSDSTATRSTTPTPAQRLPAKPLLAPKGTKP